MGAERLRAARDLPPAWGSGAARAV